ncbi:MAG TPA: adenylate/guanylate cyclase domain-containing protein [Gemmatimonadota bacterium]|nr:adenylate/guanylate cyclase domain-containing protein [Gemmatimonadota bacterium]
MTTRPGRVTRGVPETRYAKSGNVNIAYQVLGEGPVDLVYVPGWVSNLEVAWEHPGLARFFRRLAAFSRLVLFDKRGTGLSDRVPPDHLPTLEQRMDDVRAVMDEVGSERAVLMGHSEGGNMCVLFAATYPERTEALITFGIYVKRIRSTDYPWAPTPEERQEWLDLLARGWGGTVDLSTIAPSVAEDEAFARWWSRYLRMSAEPQSAVALGRMNTQIDVRAVLPTIRVPTLVLHNVGDRDVKIDEARYIAGQIPNARLVELPGEDHIPWTSGLDAILDEVEAFVTGSRPRVEPDRVLATVLFTDIVDSTGWAGRLGDAAWRDRLEAHQRMVRGELDHHRGREVKTTGDGFLATFDGPARAIRCARQIRDEAQREGLGVRAGLHSGECEMMGGDVGGIAVHIAARVLAEASPGEILVSRTVKDLVAGSGLSFEERGARALKGLEGEWQLFAVA